MNAGGFVKSRTDHQAFGEDIASGIGLRTTAQGFGAPHANRQGYGLTEKDSTGLNHTWFRKNENRAGRWTSPDPYNGSASVGNPQSWNRYSYVENQPTNFVDPSGLEDIPDEPGPPIRVETHTWEYTISSWWWIFFGGSPIRNGGHIGEGGGGGGETQTEDICDWFTTWLTQDGVYDFFQTRLKWQKEQGKEQGGLIGWKKGGKGSVRKDFDNKNGDERNLGKEDSGEFLRWAEGIISSDSDVGFRIFWHTHRNSVSPSEGDINVNKKLNTLGVIVKPGLISLFGTDGKELCRADFP